MQRGVVLMMFAKPDIRTRHVKRPTTLSTSTSSYEAPETHDPTLNRLAVTMFEKTAAYLQSEMNCAQDEYQLLEQMNKATATKYREMRESASLIAQGLSDLNDKFLSLKPFLDQIDQIDDSVSKLEQAAYKLDAYTVRLEAKFKALEKR
nr:EOG090X0J9J [Eulimnadia texana]